MPPTVPANQIRATIFTSADMQPGGPSVVYSYTRPDSLTPSSFSALPGQYAGYHGAHPNAPSLSNGSSSYISPTGYYYPGQHPHQHYMGGGGGGFVSSSPPPYSSQLRLSSYDSSPQCHPPHTNSALYSPQELSGSPTMGHAQYPYSPPTPGNPTPPADHAQFPAMQPNLPPSWANGAMPAGISSSVCL